jgi:hypothetical protein
MKLVKALILVFLTHTKKLGGRESKLIKIAIVNSIEQTSTRYPPDTHF